MFDDDNDIFKNFDEKFNHDWEEHNKSFESARHVHSVMGVVVPVLAGMVVLVVVAVCCHLCCRRRTRGRILAPPAPRSEPAGGAPYPQQQYTVAVATYPAQAGGVTYAPAYPTHHVTSHAPYPTATHAPYPTAMPAPYPTASPAPYPTASPAPYPTASPAPYPAAAPYPAPSAPHVDAPPPSYDQVQSEMKTAPYNPNYPH